jgi:hypothetical protein
MPMGGPGLRGAIDLAEAWICAVVVMSDDLDIVLPLGRWCRSYKIGHRCTGFKALSPAERRWSFRGRSSRTLLDRCRCGDSASPTVGPARVWHTEAGRANKGGQGSSVPARRRAICNRPSAHILPTICPQLHISPVISRDAFMQVAPLSATPPGTRREPRLLLRFGFVVRDRQGRQHRRRGLGLLVRADDRVFGG